MLLKMDDVVFSYGSVSVLQDVCLEAFPGEILGLVGPNGSGKTTMLRCINGILTPKQGRIAIDEEDVKELTRLELTRKIGYVPQNASAEMCTPTVFEVVLMGRRPHITWDYTKRDRDIAWEAMEEMRVKDLALKRFDQLSSGQAQRVLLARAIAQQVRMLLLDEPTSNLDIKHQIEVMRSIRNQVLTKNIGACAVVHDLDLAMRFCDKVVMLHEGKVLAAGARDEVLTTENIRKAYGVETVIAEVYGRKRVLVM
ncbi:MAG: ABC transporter ATP-binding protein [Methanomassiliicoccales archaeon]